MQDDVAEGGVAVMAVRVPAAGAQVHLHVAGPWRLVADLHDRAAEIRAALHAAETGMKNTDWLAVQALELFADQALVLPDGLQEAFGRRVTVLVKDRNDAAAHAPLGIKAGQDRGTLPIAFALLLRQCQALAAGKKIERIQTGLTVVMTMNLGTRDRDASGCHFCCCRGVCSAGRPGLGANRANGYPPRRRPYWPWKR